MTILSFFLRDNTNILSSFLIPPEAQPGRFAESPERAYTDRNRLQYQHTLSGVQRQENLGPFLGIFTSLDGFWHRIRNIDATPTYLPYGKPTFPNMGG